jgi:hypothetical protein
MIGKLWTRVITLLETLPQLEVCTTNYGHPKWWKSKFWELQDLEKNTILV